MKHCSDDDLQREGYVKNRMGGAVALVRAGVFAVFLISFGLASAQDNDPWQLAHAMVSAKEYDLAALEFLRTGYDNPAYEPLAIERAAWALQLAGKHSLAAQLAVRGVRKFGTAALGGKLAFRYCIATVLAGLDKAEPCLTRRQLDMIPPKGKLRVEYTFIMRDVVEGRCSGLQQELQELVAPTYDRTVKLWAEQDVKFCQEWEELDTYSPVAAAAFSLLIPGAGKAYIGRWGDAFFSFVSVVVPGSIAAWRFHRYGTSSALAWVSSTLAFLFYAGNVYGSYTSAQAQNGRVKEQLRHSIVSSYHSRLDPSW